MSYKAILLILVLLAASLGHAAEKLRYATPAKGTPSYELPVIAAMEKGFFKQNDLEAEWIPFRGSADLIRSVSTGHVDLGTLETISLILAASRGAPLVTVAGLKPSEHYFLWVRADGPVKEAKHLQGGKIAVVSLYDVTGAYARMVSKTLGLNIKPVAVGGVREYVAALKAGQVDAMITATGTAVMLKLRGEIRDVLSLQDYLPKPWGQHMVFARKELVGKASPLVKRGVKAMMQTADFLGKNPAWGVETMKAQYGYNDAAAKIVYSAYYEGMEGSGRIEAKGFENVKNFLLEYGVLSRDKTLALEELYTEKFLH